MKFVGQATNGDSPLPALLDGARTNDTVRDVLRFVREDNKLAGALAEAILSA
jgi:hypothetical protein